MLGKTMESVVNNDNEEIIFRATDGSVYRMWHSQDCCESVRIEDIAGDLDFLVGSPITQAIESTNEGGPEYESSTWTFYHFATMKGYVSIRWLGVSNGYYSERVDFAKISDGNDEDEDQ
jgi:hypothetical protein